MNVERQQELKAAIQSEMPLDAIVALLRQYKEQGVTQEEIYSFLEALHQTAPAEELDDCILEIADFVAGFCALHMRVWDGEKPEEWEHPARRGGQTVNRRAD